MAAAYTGIFRFRPSRISGDQANPDKTAKDYQGTLA
jgi:hypothetical protein